MNMLTPVRLPPGRFRLATRTQFHRIAADSEDIGNGRSRRLDGERRDITPKAAIKPTPRQHRGLLRRQYAATTQAAPPAA